MLRLVLLVALVLCTCTYAQDFDLDLAFQLSGILPGIFCNRDLNVYQLQIVNSLPITATYTITLNPDGCDLRTLVVDVAAQSISPLISIGPGPGCTLIDRMNTITLTVLDPFQSPTLPVQRELVSIPDTCGVVQPSDYTSGCGYGDWVCQVENQEYWHYALFMGPLALVFAIVLSLMALAVCLSVYRNRLLQGKRIQKSLVPADLYVPPTTYGVSALTGFREAGDEPLAGRTRDVDVALQNNAPMDARMAGGAGMQLQRTQAAKRAGSGVYSKPEPHQLAARAQNSSSVFL